MTATRNSSRRNIATPRATKPVKLSQRGVAVVAVTVAGLVLAAGLGATGPAALGAVALYLLLSGRGSAVAHIVPTARRALRALCWVAVAVATVTALQSQQPGPSGSALGLALAAGLATALRCTSGRRK